MRRSNPERRDNLGGGRGRKRIEKTLRGVPGKSFTSHRCRKINQGWIQVEASRGRVMRFPCPKAIRIVASREMPGGGGVRGETHIQNSVKAIGYQTGTLWRTAGGRKGTRKSPKLGGELGETFLKGKTEGKLSRALHQRARKLRPRSERRKRSKKAEFSNLRVEKSRENEASLK